MTFAEDIDNWPLGIRILALAIEASQARAWAEGIRCRDGHDSAFDQRQLELRLSNVRHLLGSVGAQPANALVTAAQAFAGALADHGDVPPEAPWPASTNLEKVMRRELRKELAPAPVNATEWVRRTDFLAGKRWLGDHAQSCPAGWLPLLERAVSQAERWVDRATLEQYHTSQIKEKFGTLRWYVGSNEVLSVIVDYAELTSAFTCLACGAEGKLRSDRSWYLTLCDTHDKLDRQGNIHALTRIAYPSVTE